MKEDILEVITKAIENEKSGEAFYRKSAEEADDPEIRAIFETLAQDEQNHQRILKERLLALKLRREKL